MRSWLVAGAGIAALLYPAVVVAQGVGDPAKGEARFHTACGACHSVAPGQNGIGPSLHGVVGRKAASGAGFSYSSAMTASGLAWDAASLDRFIAAPAKTVPGTSMSYFGLRKADDRADVIAYLQQQGDAAK